MIVKNKRQTSADGLSLLLCVCVGILIGIYLISTNITTNETMTTYWDDVEMTAEEYSPAPVVSISDMLSPTFSDDLSAESSENHDSLSVIQGIDVTDPDKFVEITNMMREKFKNAYWQNHDVIAWIYFPSEVNGDYVNEGVYWNGTSYYLNFNAAREKNGGGQLFVDQKTDPTIQYSHPKATLIHGHNMNSGAHFGRLNLLTDSENFENDRFVYVYDGKYDVVEIYVTYSCLIFAANNYTPQTYMYSDKTEDDYREYADLIAKLSMYDCDYQYTNIISLHTCNKTFKGAHLLLSAYKLNNEQKTKCRTWDKHS